MNNEEVVQTQEIWAVLPGTYEKWVNPSNRNDKHYRVIYRSNIGKRRVGDEQFKTASKALAFSDQLTSEKRVFVDAKSE